MITGQTKSESQELRLIKIEEGRILKQGTEKLPSFNPHRRILFDL
jgi:hypothetical protein